MRSERIILLSLLFAVGCHPIGPSVQPLAVAPAGPPPVIVQPMPGQTPPIYFEPGAPVAGQPQVVLPPQAMPPSGMGEPPQPGWWDVLPNDSGAISPDFGLPRGPVVENRLPNPLVVPVANNELAWDQLADVVTNYFPIKREQPVQLVGGVLTEGFIETPFQVGATLFEPHRNDSVGSFNRWQSTLQTIRRKAVINVQPTGGGYAVGVTVVKQLEDLPKPVRAPSGAAVLRTDGSLPSSRRFLASPTAESPFWIDLGRDEPLEQELLRRIRDRLTRPLTPSASQPVF